MVNKNTYNHLISEIKSKSVTLVAVSKTKSIEEIKELYDLGQRDFGENYVQELLEKEKLLPKDIRWHFIGHLQSNKVKQLLPVIHLIQSVDSLRLLKEIDKQSAKLQKKADCLLQVHIASEETKFGLNERELDELIKEVQNNQQEFSWVNIKGLMGMASLTEDMTQVRIEFRNLKQILHRLSTTDSRLSTLSMGMTADYKIAIEEGSNLIRIGSLLFGERE